VGPVPRSSRQSVSSTGSCSNGGWTHIKFASSSAYNVDLVRTVFYSIERTIAILESLLKSLTLPSDLHPWVKATVLAVTHYLCACSPCPINTDISMQTAPSAYWLHHQTATVGQLCGSVCVQHSNLWWYFFTFPLFYSVFYPTHFLLSISVPTALTTTSTRGAVRLGWLGRNSTFLIGRVRERARVCVCVQCINVTENPLFAIIAARHASMVETFRWVR
jgi:hypothetical protein